MNIKKAKQLIKNDEWTLNEYSAIERFINELYEDKHEIVDSKPKIEMSEEITLYIHDYIQKTIIPELIKTLKSNNPKTNLKDIIGIY